MHNYTNNFEMNLRSFEIQEARKRMNSANADQSSLDLNASVNNLSSDTTSYLNNYTNLSSLNQVPNLNNTLSVDYNEVQHAKGKIRESSTTNLIY